MAIFDLQFQRSDSQKLIFVAMTVIVVAALVERYSGVSETASIPQIFLGAFIATALLILLSYILPEFAVGLAIIAAVTMIVAKGKPFWDAVAKLEKNTGTTSSGSPSAPSAPNPPVPSAPGVPTANNPRQYQPNG